MDHTSIILVTIFLLVVIALAAVTLKAAINLLRKGKEEDRKKKTEVGFVVDTFHDLVARLKEKEKELEGLKERAEARASSFELYNENILQSVPSGVVGLDDGLRVTKMNHSAERILNLSEGDVMGKAHNEVFADPIASLITQRKTVDRAELGYTTRSGKRIWLGLNVSPLRDGAGSVIGQILIFTDLTELKAFQSQRELRERLSTLGEMSAGIAHELRNPMAVISGYTKILLKKVDQASVPAVEAIAREVNVMDRIITDFLSFARPNEPVLAHVDLRELVEGCVQGLTASARGVSLQTDWTDLPKVRADEVLLRQAVTNLIQNGLEAMPDGGVLKVAGSADDGVVLSFSDTGHGVSESIRDKIFLPFYTTKERGTGLGLSIVHKIVVSHGGTISVESGQRGTTFTIRLPKTLLV